jgi:hypothetical protein
MTEDEWVNNFVKAYRETLWYLKMNQ